MKKWIITFLILWLLAVPARGADIPDALWDALPEEAEQFIVEDAGGLGWPEGLARIGTWAAEQGKKLLRAQTRGAASVLLVVVLCGAVESFGGKAAAYAPMAGGLAVTLLTAGDLGELIGLGNSTIGELSAFSKVLLPTLAAATAVSGSAATASMQQVTTVFLVSLLVSLIDSFLMPLCYLYIGTLAAGVCLGEGRLSAMADGMKKGITWLLTTTLLLFTIYLSVSRVLTGATDAAAVRVTKAAISGVVPVVGGIISEVSESVLAGAGVVKNTIGVFGMLAVLGVCVGPFLRLGVQYLLYKAVAFLSGAVGAEKLCKLINGLGGAFGLVLGMTGSCAALVLVSVLTFIAAVTP